MNCSRLFLLLWCALSSFAFAESDFERELKQLIEQRDKARAAAIAPIDAKFKVAAEQLLRRATQLGDLDSANKIKAAIDASSGLKPATEAPGAHKAANEAPVAREVKPAEDFRKQFVGTQWKADPKFGLHPGLKDTLSFTEKSVEPYGYSYESNAKNSVTIIFNKGGRQSMTLTPDGKRLEFTFRNKEHAYDLVSP